MSKNVPHGWKESPIFEVAPIESKLVDPKLDEYSQLTLIAPDHIQQKSGQLIAKKTASEQSAISGKYLVLENDVIYSKIRPYLMKAVISPERCLCSADMYPLHCNGEIEPRYLHSILLSDRFTYYANSCSARTGIPKLNREDMGEYVLTLPPLPEQKAIADLLSTWDEAIEKTEQLIVKKQKFYEAQLSKRLSSDVSERIKLKKFLKEVSKRNSDLSINQVLSVTNSKGFVRPEDQFDRQVANDNLSNYKIVSKGEYAYNPSRINVGSIARLDDWDFGVLSPMYTVFEIKKPLELHTDLFLHWLNSHEAKQRIRLSAQGTVRETVSFDDFCAIGFPKIDIKEQKALAEYFSLISAEIDTLKALSERYKTQKRGLMQKMLTGEWRVRGFATNDEG